jgi:hypothetical protein
VRTPAALVQFTSEIRSESGWRRIPPLGTAGSPTSIHKSSEKWTIAIREVLIDEENQESG